MCTSAEPGEQVKAERPSLTSETVFLFFGRATAASDRGPGLFFLVFSDEFEEAIEPD